MAGIKRIILGGATISPWFGDLGLTILRVFAGLALAYQHGWGKMPPSDGFIAGVEAMGFPMPIAFAWGAGLSEFLGGLLLAAGLATRPAALAIVGTMGVAAFVAHAGDDFGTREPALLFGSIGLAFACLGGGRFSLDRTLR